jgi:anaerobic selenocysteine-containing dehydrogenase
MTEVSANGLTRRRALGWMAVGGTAVALPKFLEPTAAAALSGEENAETMALFLGGDRLPVPPENAARYTTACQFCNVGCGYIVYTWPVEDTPEDGTGALGGELPGQALGEWVAPSFVTRRDINGVDSYVAVVPDKDCVVNRGDHSPRGGTNALTVYTDREHPLTKPDERLLVPQIRDEKGGELRDASWDEALDLIADRLQETLDSQSPSAIGAWIADTSRPSSTSRRPSSSSRSRPPASTTRASAPTRGLPSGRSTTGLSGTPSIRRSRSTSDRIRRCSTRTPISRTPTPS